MGTRLLTQLTDLYIQDATLLKPYLVAVDLFNRIVGRVGNVPAEYFDLYVNNYHPLQKVAFKNTSAGLCGDPRHSSELEGFEKARLHMFDLLQQNAPLSIADMIALNTLLRGYELHDDANVVSDVRKQVLADQKTVLLYEAAEPRDYEACLSYYLNLVNNNPHNLHPLVLAAQAVSFLCLIHPFVDANGRTARLIALYIMKKNGYELMHPVFEHYYTWDSASYAASLEFRGEYYTVFDQAVGITQKWNRYFLTSIYQAYKLLFKVKLLSKLAQFKKEVLKREVKVHHIVMPAPDNAGFHISRSYIRKRGNIVGTWIYKNQEGKILAYFIRFAGKKSNEYRKSYLVFQYYTDRKWHSCDFFYMEKYPIYGLHKITSPYDGKYLLCEGEKAADAAERLAGDTSIRTLSAYRVVIYASKADWSPLAGAEVYIWRDNDESGKKAEQEVCGILAGLGCKVKLLADDALTGKPEKWDAADALAEGMTPAEFRTFLEGFIPYRP